MGGTRKGGLKAKAANLAKDPEYYIKLGMKGGKWNDPSRRPFAQDKELAKLAGIRGGKAGKRKKKEKS